jgi:hypothetical protein
MHVLSSNKNTINIVPFSKYGSGSIYFNGSDFLTLVPNTGLSAARIGTSNFTIECWIYPTLINSTARRIISSKNGAATTNSLILSINNTNKLELNIGTNIIISNTTLIANNWYHCAISRINGSIHLTINGIIEKILSNIVSDITETNFTIGGDITQYFVGYLDDVRFTIGNCRYTNVFAPSRNTPLSIINNTGFLLDYDNTYKSSFGLDYRNVCMSILSGYSKYYETVIKDAYLSAGTIDPALSSAVALSLSSTRFNEFGLDNSSLFGKTTLELNAPLGLIEGTYHFNNSIVGNLPVGSGLLGKYQPNNSNTDGFVYTNFNKITGYNITYTNGGQRFVDSTITYNNNNTERLTPFNNIIKLRSGSKYVALNQFESVSISVYVRVDSTYNGNVPKLILKSNPSMGVMNDLTIATTTITNNFQSLSGSFSNVSNDGILEFYVECDGTSGFINIAEWEAK